MPSRPVLSRSLLDDDANAHPSWLSAAGVYAFGWLMLGWPWLSGRAAIPWDAKAQFQPQVQFLADALARGESPAWNPYVFAGHPQIADPQSLMFSPLMVLLAMFNGAPSGYAVDTTVYLAILIAGIAIIAWFRDRGWHLTGGIVAALSFGFGAAMAWRIQHTGQVLSLATLPVVILFLDRALASSTPPRSALWNGLWAGLAASALVLGRDQVSLLSVYLLIGFVIWRLVDPASALSEGERRGDASDRFAGLKRGAAPLAVACLSGLAVVALPVLLTAALASQSNRPAIDFLGAGAGSLHPASALTLFAPDVFGATGSSWDYWGAPSFAWHERWGNTGLNTAQNMGQLYLGAIPALLILIGLGSGVAFQRGIGFFTGALGLMTLYALGWYTPLFKLAHMYVPGVTLFRRPADAVFLIGYLGAILAGYTLHRLLADSHTLSARSVARGAALAAVTTLAAFITVAVLAVRMEHVGVATHPMMVSIGLFALGAAVLLDALWLLPIRPLLASALLIGFTVVDLAISNGPGSSTALPPSTFDVLNPKTRNETIALLKSKTAEGRSDTRRDRVELAGLGFHWPNASMTHRLENTLGYNPVRLGLYTQATGAGDTVGLPEQRTFSALFPSYKSQLADLLGLRFIASGVPLKKLDPKAEPADFPLIAQTADGYIYENPRAFPRVVFASSAAPADFDQILKTGTWPDEDLRATVLLSPQDEKASGYIATRGTGEAHLTSYENTEIEIAVDSTRGGYVVLFDVWHPWWTATLDGAPVPILRADVLFRAVRVLPGHQVIRFAFEPVHGALAGR